ncbi:MULTISPECIES: hypothetical protein [unclassified Corynebacterium]|uniref:hypothetical protein n=1 Tax=unclassified Corynebacterium TaxID=2624378 RepID=UPI00403381A9
MNHLAIRCIDCGEPLDDQLAVHPMCTPCCKVAVHLLGDVDTRIRALEGDTA